MLIVILIGLTAASSIAAGVYFHFRLSKSEKSIQSLTTAKIRQEAAVVCRDCKCQVARFVRDADGLITCVNCLLRKK